MKAKLLHIILSSCKSQQDPNSFATIPLQSIHSTLNSLVLDRPGLELTCGVVLVALSAHKPPVLAFPDECECEEQHHETDSTNGVEDVCHTDRIDPRNHSEYEDCAQHVPHKCQSNKCVTDDLYSLN